MWGADGVTPIPIRWLLVVDPTGNLDPLPLMSTDPLLSADDMIRMYIDRWSLEVTFEETREHLGVETQRQWSDKAIARTTPILMGLYSLVCLMARQLAQDDLIQPEKTVWHQKDEITFSDMIRAVRFLVWKENLISRKVKKDPSRENITVEMKEWMESILQMVLQAA